MPRIAWLTDLHLDFLSPDEARSFLDRVRGQQVDAVVISGDMSEARDLDHDLRTIADRLELPVYFVLGNHDFYYGSIREVRKLAQAVCAELPNLHYLTTSGVIELSPRLGLVGHDGWADARLGDYETSFVMMNDYLLIAELAGYNKEDRWPVLNALGDEAAAHIRKVLPLALQKYPEVLLVTHVPPMREACWHEGQLSDDEWLPHFSCRAMGDAILDVMRHFPQRKLTVLCGHTHSAGECRPRDNITIYTGGAKYGLPVMQRVFEWE